MKPEDVEPCGTGADGVSPPPPLPSWRPWSRELPRALLYPLRTRGVTFILFSAFIWSAGECGGFYYARVVTLTLVSFYIAYAYAYVVNILRASAGGDDRLPPLGFGQDLVDDVLHPLRYLIVTLFLCYLPILVIVNYKGGLWGVWLFLTIPAHVPLEPWEVVVKMLGSFYLPMAVLAVTMNEDLRAASPHFVVPAILKVPLQYIIVAGAFMWANGLHNNILSHIAHADWGEASVVQFFVKVGLLYVYCVLARVLGMTHWVYRERLGWFERV